MSGPHPLIGLPPDLRPIPDSTVRTEAVQELETKLHGFVPLKPLNNPFDAGIVDEALAAQVFPPLGTEYDRPVAIRRCNTIGAKVETLGLEFTQYKFKLKLDDLTGKVLVLGQRKI